MGDSAAAGHAHPGSHAGATGGNSHASAAQSHALGWLLPQRDTLGDHALVPDAGYRFPHPVLADAGDPHPLPVAHATAADASATAYPSAAADQSTAAHAASNYQYTAAV